MKIRTARRDVTRIAWHDSWWRIAIRAVAVALGAAVAVLAVAIFLVPRLLGGTSLTVLTGSMEPGLEPGDVVVTRGVDASEVCTDVHIGDIVTFLPYPDDPTLITHRVVGKTIGTFEDGTDCRLVTQGDANAQADEPVSPEQVRGVFLYGVPKLGWLREWAADNQAVVVIGAVVIVGGWLLWDALRPARTRVIVPADDAGDPADPEPAHMSQEEYALRRRELDLREREIALREAEFAHLLRAESAAPAPAGTDRDLPVAERSAS